MPWFEGIWVCCRQPRSWKEMMDWGWRIQPSICPSSWTPLDLLLQEEMLHSQMTCAMQRNHFLSRKGAHGHQAAFPLAFPTSVICPFLGCSFWIGRAHSQPPGYQTTGVSDIRNQLPNYNKTHRNHTSPSHHLRKESHGHNSDNVTLLPESQLSPSASPSSRRWTLWYSAASRDHSSTQTLISAAPGHTYRYHSLQKHPPTSRWSVPLHSQCSLHPAHHPAGLCSSPDS